MKKLPLLPFVLLLAASVGAVDRRVYNDAEPREGYLYPNGTKVVVTEDSAISIIVCDDPGSMDRVFAYANGVNATFGTAKTWDLAEAGLPWTMFEYGDTVYVCLNDYTRMPARVYKFYRGALVLYDTIQAAPGATLDSTSFGFSYLNTDGTNWLSVYKTNLYQTTTYNMRVSTLTNGRIGGATAFVNGDTLRMTGATTQHKLMAAPTDGGLTLYEQDRNAFSLIEKDGTITKRCLTSAFGQRKYASTSINFTDGNIGTNAFYDMSITPVDPSGQGDSALMIMCDSTTNAVKAYTVWADTVNNDIFLVDSANLSGTGDKSDILDSAGWRTPTITMAGTGCIAYYRDWADTTDLATVRIAYHVATDWSDLSTFGTVQYLSTDSSGAGGTIGAIMAPQTAVAHNDTDSVYAYVVWNRWDATMNIFETYTAIGMPGANPPAAHSRRIPILKRHEGD